MYLLTGDIGGTHTRLQVLCHAENGWYVVHELHRRNADFGSLHEAVATCLTELSPHERRRIAGACLGVAGPVHNGTVRMTNLPWEASEYSLAAQLAIPAVHILNDLEALAHGIDTLTGNDYITVRDGRAIGERSLVISVGTGLGMTLRYSDATHTEVFSSEGGHADFAPIGDEQIALLRELASQYDHVSYERILSGTGLVTLHRYACRQRGRIPSPLVTGADDPAAAITALATQGSDDCATAAVRLFVQVLGAFAGNSAMQWLPNGGIYFAGGVLVHLQHHLLATGFEQHFSNKGRMAPLLANVPVRLVTDANVALAGALKVADKNWGTLSRRSPGIQCGHLQVPSSDEATAASPDRT